MRLRQITVGLGLLVVALAVSGTCSSVPTPSTSVPTPSTSAEFGSLGGALTFPDGGSLEIPPGALDGSVKITASTIAAPNESAFATVGPFYELQPEGQSFDASVTVRLPIPGFTENDAGIERWAMLTVVGRDGGGWDRIPSWVDPDTASVVTFVKRLSPVGAAIWQSNVCTATSACPGAGAAFCVMGQLVISGCGASGSCMTSVVQDCRPNGGRCIEGACVAIDAGAIADAGAVVDAGSVTDAGPVADAGVAFCGCEPDAGDPYTQKPDGGDLFVVDGGCANWNDATFCSGWHSVIGYDAGVDPFGLFPSGTQYTYFNQSCTIEIRCF